MDPGSLIFGRGARVGVGAPDSALRAWAEQLRVRRLERENDALPDTVAEFRRASIGDEPDRATVSEAARRLRDSELEATRPEAQPPSGDEQMQRELEARDREVRAHELAHHAAAGDLAAGGPSYTFQTGPDGKRYAIGGEVKIRLQKGRTPEETIRNMQRVIRAANAPESPSGPDRAVAGQAARIATEARNELRQQRREEQEQPDDRGVPGAAGDAPGGRARVDLLV